MAGKGPGLARELGMGGSRYEGDWERGMRHGYGRHTFVVTQAGQEGAGKE
jgi:hypothetical protein